MNKDLEAWSSALAACDVHLCLDIGMCHAKCSACKRGAERSSAVYVSVASSLLLASAKALFPKRTTRRWKRIPIYTNMRVEPHHRAPSSFCLSWPYFCQLVSGES